MIKGIRILTMSALLFQAGCSSPSEKKSPSAERTSIPTPALTLEGANRLSKLPFKCMDTEYPNTMQNVVYSKSDIKNPKTAHPAFYGCFDWHSSVHGHWSLVKLLKQFPDLGNADKIREKLAVNLSRENVMVEVEYLKGKYNKPFERAYGWAWLLKLAEELHTWDDPLAKKLEQNLQPLSLLIVNYFTLYLPDLKKPVRSGVHPNTAFALAFAWDYSVATGNDSLKNLIEQRARDYYLKDSACKTLEPEGADFFTPCLEEMDIMRRVLPKEEMRTWIARYIPALSQKTFSLDPGKVADRTDGHLGHVDGVNFSRAWCLLGLANDLPGYEHLRQIAFRQIDYSLPGLLNGDGGNYDASGHWLGTFAIYALNSIQKK